MSRQAIYPVRPMMQAKESLPGYIARFHISNGYKVSRDLNKAAYSLCYGNKISDALNLIASWSGSAEWPSKIWLREQLEKYNQKSLPRWQTYKARAIRVCPKCLKESGFHHYLWELPLVRACPQHASQLVCVCPSCNQSLTWLRIRDKWLCECGNSIKNIASRDAKLYEVQLAKLIANANLVFPSGGRQSTSNYSLDDVYRTIAWASYFRATLVEGRQIWPSWPDRCSVLIRTPGAWETKMLAGRRAVTRNFQILARWWFYREEGALVQFSDVGAERRMFSFVGLLDNEQHVFAKTIRQSLETFLNSSRAVSSNTLRLYYHPRLSINARRRVISTFCSWWNSISSSTKKLRKNGLNVQRGEYRGLTKGRQILDILNCMIDCSNRNYSNEVLQNFLNAWPMISHQMRPLKAEEILERFINCFSLMQPFEVDALYDALLLDMVACQ